MTGSAEPHRGVSTSLWIRRRALNVYRHPARLATLAGLLFVLTLLLLVLVPVRARRAAAALAAPVQRPDTAPLVRERARALASFSGAVRTLDSARALFARRSHAESLVAPLVPTVAARRDSLAALTAELSSLLARADRAPLPTSYRALARARALQGDARVQQLADSLDAIERVRDRLEAAGGVDPIFVALTAHATQIGKAIDDVAITRRAALRRELASLAPAQPPPTPAIDTLPLVAARNASAQRIARVDRILADARAMDDSIDARLDRAREIASVGASPLAMLGAAMTIGIALAFTILLVLEMRWPRVADAGEAESATGASVLVSIERERAAPERSRRRADREVPPLIQPNAQSHRLLHARLAGAAFTVARASVLGDEPTVTAAVAANLAAVAASMPCAVLLIDADLATGAVAEVMRVRATPGVTELLAGTAQWPETIVSGLVGRGSTIDVMPSGVRRRDLPPADAVLHVTNALERAERRYDTVVVSGSASSGFALELAASIGGPTVVCARIARTAIAEVRALVGALRERGVELAGIVLWTVEDPPRSSGVGGVAEHGVGGASMATADASFVRRLAES